MTYPPAGSDPGSQPWQPSPATPPYPHGGYGQPAGFGYAGGAAPGYPPAFPTDAGYGQPVAYPSVGYGPPAAPGFEGSPLGYPGAPGYPVVGNVPFGGYGYTAGAGFPGAVPPKQGLPKAVIFGGIGLVVVLVLVLAIVFWPSGGGLFSSDADQIKALMHTKIDRSDTSALKAHHCAADASLIDKFAKYDRAPGPAGTPDRPGTKIDVGEPKINGNTATVDITATSGSLTLPVTQYFRKEGGEWKYCSSDDPKMKHLSNLPGWN